MRILMMTNSYTPVVGGLERSIISFKTALQKRGHRVLVAAPSFTGMPPRERDVIRLAAIRHFTRHDFSVALPLSARMTKTLMDFAPDVIHSHHPFFMGNAAVRISRLCNAPLVFTHHILFEQYAHYLPLQSPAMKRFVVDLSTGYANLCQMVFAPSESLAEHLRKNGVTSPIAVVPTGVAVERFAHGNGASLRKAMGIPPQAFLVGHIGRLTQEKNLLFLAQAVAEFLRRKPQAHCFIAGQGPMTAAVADIFQQAGVGGRFHHAGVLSTEELRDAYHAMNVFAFASKSETQGIVLVEAMASGVPVVAIDAPGVREIVRDGENGRLLAAEEEEPFVQALQWVEELAAQRFRLLADSARTSASHFSVSRCTTRALAGYRQALANKPVRVKGADYRFKQALRRLRAEWELLKAFTQAIRGAGLHAGRN